MAKMTMNMNVEMADEVLAQFAQALGEVKGAKKLVIEIKDVGGRMEISAEPTEASVARGAATGSAASREA